MRLEINPNAAETSKSESFNRITSVEDISTEMLQALRHGIEAAKAGNRNEARVLLMRVVEAEPKNETAWLWLASISEYPEELLVFLQNVLNINPENSRAIEWTKQTKSLLAKNVVQRGITASQENQKDVARQCFLQAIAHDNQNEMAWLWLASIVDSAEEKISHLKKVLSINAENETAISSLKMVKNQMAQAVLKKANQAVVVGDRDTARSYLQEAMKHDDKCEEVWLLKAHITDSFDEKVGYFNKVLEINPENESAKAGLVSIEAVMKSVVIQPKAKEEVHLEEKVESFSQKEIQHSIEESFAQEAVDEVVAEKAEEENLLEMSEPEVSETQESIQHFEDTKPEVAEQIAEGSNKIEECNTAEEQTAEVKEVLAESEEENTAAENLDEVNYETETLQKEVVEEEKVEATAVEEQHESFDEERQDEEAAVEEVTTAEVQEIVAENVEEAATEEFNEEKVEEAATEEFNEEKVEEAATEEVVAEEQFTEEVVEEITAENEGLAEESESEVVNEKVVDSETSDTQGNVEEETAVESFTNHIEEEVATEVLPEAVTEELINEIEPNQEVSMADEVERFTANSTKNEVSQHSVAEVEPASQPENDEDDNFLELNSFSKITLEPAKSEETIVEAEEVAVETAKVEPAKEIGNTSFSNFNPDEALKDVGSYSFKKLKPEEFPREIGNYAFLNIKPEIVHEKNVQSVSFEQPQLAAFEQQSEAKVEPVAEMTKETNETADEPVQVDVSVVEEHEPVVETAVIEEFEPAVEKTQEQTAPKVEGTWESFESKVEAMVEAAEEKHETKFQVCPFCSSANAVSDIQCNSCHAMMDLLDVQMVLDNNQVDKESVFDAIRKKELEKLGKEFSGDDYEMLGLAYLNVHDVQNAHDNLKLALHFNPMSVELNSQVMILSEKVELREANINREEKAKEKVSHTILVVDDSPTVRKLISTKLERHGHTVVSAVDGMDALAKINEVVPDLILLDITMPRLDGYQVCKLIRNNEVTKTTPIVMISGKDGFFDKVRGRMAGSTDFISKPFGPEILMKMLETHIH